MKIRSLVPWHGAKRKKELLAPIRTAIGRPLVLVEPMCGSCAVSLSVEADVHVVNDLHLDLFNLMRCVQDEDACGWMVERLAAMAMSEDQMRACQFALEKGGELDPASIPNPQRALAYLYVCWTGCNGFAGTIGLEPWFNVRFSGGGGDPAARLRAVLESMPVWWQRMRHWTITNRDCFEMMTSLRETADRSGMAIYLDPPYHPDSRSGPDYKHEFRTATLFSSEDDHARVEELARSFRHARIVVSYYDCEAVRSLYRKDRGGWFITENTCQKSLSSASESSSEAPELIIVRN
jgi:site-specific DNA-adenine methylase